MTGYLRCTRSSLTSAGLTLSLISSLHKTPAFLPTADKMADVDMPDVDSAAPSKAKGAVKTSKSGPSESASDGKKRFEVKKVGHGRSGCASQLLI